MNKTLDLVLVDYPNDLLEQLEKTLKSIGAQLANPADGRITWFSTEGEQLVCNRCDIAYRLKQGEESNVQFWFSASEDLFVSWSFDGHTTSFVFALDGVEPRQIAALVASVLRDYFLTIDDARGRSLILDYD